MSIWKRWHPCARTWLVVMAFCSGVSLFLAAGTASASSVNTFKISGAAKGTLRVGADSNCLHGIKTLAQNHGNMGLTDLVGSISGYKSIAPTVLGMSAPKDGSYKLSAAQGIFVTLSMTLKGGNLYFNSTSGTMTIKGQTGSIQATLVPGVNVRKKISFVGSWSCKG